MSDSLSSLWGHSVHSAKFTMLRFSEGYCSHSFHLISTKLYDKYAIDGEYRLLIFWRSPKNYKFYGTFNLC